MYYYNEPCENTCYGCRNLAKRLQEAEQENAELKKELQSYKDCLEPFYNGVKAQAILDCVDSLDWSKGIAPEDLCDYARQLRGE